MQQTTGNDELLCKMVLSAWDGQNANLLKFLNGIPDAELAREIAPGKNTGIYVLGHLVAIADAMLPLLGFGDKLFPQLEEVFVRNPDKSSTSKPSVAELKQNLAVINQKLSEHFGSTSPEGWLLRHMSVSEEDFAKQPHRNKLSIVISRTNHLAYHIGQLILLNKNK